MSPTYIARLHEGGRVVRDLPLPGSPVDVLHTPRMVPAAFTELEADLAASEPSEVTVDRWRWSGGAMFGTLTTEEWIRSFGTMPPPRSLDLVREQVHVCWLRFFLA